MMKITNFRGNIPFRVRFNEYMFQKWKKSYRFEIQRLIFHIIMPIEMMVTMIMNTFRPTRCLLFLLSFFHLPFFNFFYCDSSFTYYRKWLVLKTYWCMNLGRRQKSVLEDIRGTSNVILFLALIYYHARCHEREAESTLVLNTYYIQPVSAVPLR